MKKSHRQKKSTITRYERAAFVRGETVNISGPSLEEVCRFHKGSIRKTASYDLRAIEQGKFAVFMLSQIRNFQPEKRKAAARHIIVLLETAIETLTNLENRENSKYRHIIRDFRAHLETAAGL